ncbi:hypothetical protein AAMO2058_000300500 [Amorphochlora amoebiformis]
MRRELIDRLKSCLNSPKKMEFGSQIADNPPLVDSTALSPPPTSSPTPTTTELPTSYEIFEGENVGYRDAEMSQANNTNLTRLPFRGRIGGRGGHKTFIGGRGGRRFRRTTRMIPGPLSSTLHVFGFKRPLDLNQVKNHLKSAGKLEGKPAPELQEFWITTRRDQCFVKYPTINHSRQAATFLQNSRFPVNVPNSYPLRVSYIDPHQAMQRAEFLDRRDRDLVPKPLKVPPGAEYIMGVGPVDSNIHREPRAMKRDRERYESRGLRRRRDRRRSVSRPRPRERSRRTSRRRVRFRDPRGSDRVRRRSRRRSSRRR